MALLAIAVTLLYILSAGLISGRLFHQQGPKHKLSAYCATIAMLLHLLLLVNSIFIAPGQNMSMGNVASLIAWLISVSMTIAAFRLPNALLLPVVYGFTGLVVAFNLFIPIDYIVQIQMHPALLSHITIALFAYGCLMIALLYAFQLAYINYSLKHKQLSLINSPLPPLMLVEQVLFRLLLVGTILLGLSLISGFLFLDNMLAQGQAHKTILSVIAWFIFAGLLFAHHQYGVRGKPVISATVVGSILLTLAYFGSRFVKEVILN